MRARSNTKAAGIVEWRPPLVVVVPLSGQSLVDSIGRGRWVTGGIGAILPTALNVET